jgi:hypothetical protein
MAAPPAGKKFFQKKKQPIPVDLTSKDWAGQVRKATEATYMFHTGGTSLSIRWRLDLAMLQQQSAHLYFMQKLREKHQESSMLCMCNRCCSAMQAGQRQVSICPWNGSSQSERLTAKSRPKNWPMGLP